MRTLESRRTYSRALLIAQLIALSILALGIPIAASAGVDGEWRAVAAPGGRLGATALHDSAAHRILMFGGTNGASRNDLWALDLDDSTWSYLEPAGAPPSPRQYHAAAFDSARDRWIIVGGIENTTFIPQGSLHNDAWALSLSGAPSWVELIPTGSPPSPREGHTAVYDAAEDRVLVFGGSDGALRNDVWALDLSGTPAWSAITPVGTPPAPRRNHVAMFDPVRQRMLVFGGNTGSQVNDVWELDFTGTPTWTQLSPTGSPPTSRSYTGALYDAAGDRWLISGGFDGGALKDDLWSLSLAGSTSWTELFPAGPSPGIRTHHTVVRDPVSGDMLYLGGANNAGPQLPNDVWALSLTGPPVWSEIPVPPSPSGRLAHTAIHDSPGNRMILFGGQAGTAKNDVWALSLVEPPAWTELETSGTPPSPRSDHAAINDSLRDRMIVFGGSLSDETWELSLDDTLLWNEVVTSGGPPPGRLSHTAIPDPARDRMIVFGGTTATSLLNDVWALSLSTHTWTELLPAGPAPIGRRDHVAVYDSVRDQMLVYGGFSNTSPLHDDVWALSLGAQPAWMEILPTGAVPEGPLTHAGLFDASRDRLIAFGGNYHHDVWALSFAPDTTWTLLAPTGNAPTGRVDHAVIFDPAGDRMVAFSGHSGLTALTDTWILEWDVSTAVLEPSAFSESSPGSAARLLGPGSPNPARGETAVSFSLAAESRVSIAVYDLRGRLVRTLIDERLRSGDHTCTWHGFDEAGRAVSSGTYFLRLQSGDHDESRRITVIR